MKKAKMRAFVLLLLSVVVPCVVSAQTDGVDGGDSEAAVDTVSLDEVLVSAERVNNKGDALRLFPTKEQKSNSTNAYGLLSRLALPDVIVSEVEHTVSLPPTLGNIQVRINDAVATKADLMSLDPATVRYVDYVRNPGARYGQDVDYLINITADRAQTGYTVLAEAMQTVTSMRNSDNVSAKLIKGKHEFGAGYSFGYSRTENMRYEETADYLMPDNTVTTLRRIDDGYHRNNLYHDLQLHYSVADSARYALKVTLGGSLSRLPDDTRRRVTTGGGMDDEARISSTDDTSSAIFDAYLKYNITGRQTLTADITGNYAHSDYSYSYGGKSPYAYSSSGGNGIVAGELVYENVMRPFTLSGGVRWYAERNDVDYSGGISASNSIRNNNVYVFSQIAGTLSKLSYRVGVGASRYRYVQAQEQYRYWLFRPQLQLSYSPLRPLRMSYDLTMSQHPPRLEYLGDVLVRNNEYELTAGNSALRANKVLEQSLSVSLQYPSFYTQVMTCYRMMPHCSMLHIECMTDADGKTVFVSSRTNQRRINMFYINNYTRYDVLPGKLSFTSMAGVYRFFNYGDDYTHLDTSFNFSVGAQAYLGRLSLTANVDNGWNFTEGESRSRAAVSYCLTASYKFGDFTLSAFWQHCFQDEVRMFQTEQLNRYVHKMQRMYSGDMGNMISVRLSWRLSKGRWQDKVRHNARKTDSGTGIMKN